MKEKFVPRLLPFSVHEYDSESALVLTVQTRHAASTAIALGASSKL